MKYAVIETGGKQYKVSEGQVVEIERISQPSSSKNLEKNKPVEFNEVLLIVDDAEVNIGQPKLASVVKGKIVDQLKDKKLIVFKYKAKTGYHRTIGHRQKLTKVLIEKIGGASSDSSQQRK
ncbi:50S ribosomal protein L21 [Patescibacteria group bacterium]|nr:50S ribosomal protein L21 [Patescibacteria group bacterium]